ncbi:hypothetical protein F0L68_03145 [Solihabitans fulvus]|uniref:DUF6542 domain-containing protein n=1 Tax=Solihabitans fulvus TaxID=1892852 RepID=A0A5B2XTE7_9PSEU|nr:hypothetical protein F0L68_03145 [Solihabitans fulvus]
MGVSAVFGGIGIAMDGPILGWVFGAWLAAGAFVAAALVRPVGLWIVVPAPPAVFLVLAAANAAWRRQTAWGSEKKFLEAAAPWFIHGFPHLALAIAVALGVAVIRAVFGRSRAANPVDDHA